MKGYGKSTYLKRILEGEESLALVDTLSEHGSWCPVFPSTELDSQVLYLSAPPERFKSSFLLPAGEAEVRFNFLAKAAYLAGGLTFAIEEVDYFSNPQSDAEGLETLVRFGRKRGVNIVWVTRNLAEVSRKLTSQTDAFVCFRTQEPRYVEGLGDRLTDELATEISNLPRFHYISASKDGEIDRGEVSP